MTFTMRKLIRKINWFYVAAALGIAAGAAMIGVATMGIGAPLIIGGICCVMVSGILIFFGSTNPRPV
jgi:hypothetical protein